MKVVIVATYLAPELGGGVARYEREVLPRLIPILAGAGCKVSVLVLEDGRGLAAHDGVEIVSLPVGRGQPFKRILYDQIYTSFHSCRAEVLLSLESWLPLLPVWSKRSLVVLHDAYIEVEWRRGLRNRPPKALAALLYWRAVSLRAARASDKIITDSAFAAHELSQMFNLPLAKITPIYCGMDAERFRPICDPEVIAGARRRYSLPPRFYLFVGPPMGDKNLRFILETYAGLDAGRARPLPVVVANVRPGQSPEADILAQIEGSGKSELIQFIGRVADDDFAAVYSAAHALVFPSLHEGFGLPPVEAMACGCPVVATNRTSVPEVVGDAAILFDPASPQSFLEALDRVNDESVRRDLRARGLERAQTFSWDNTARQIAEQVVL